jgi:hypothetical protein
MTTSLDGVEQTISRRGAARQSALRCISGGAADAAAPEPIRPASRADRNGCVARRNHRRAAATRNAMHRHTDPALTRLDAGALMTLPCGAGHGIAVFAGLVWIAGDDRRRDRFLAAGDSLLLRGEGRVAVQAIGATQLLVFDAAAAAA